MSFFKELKNDLSQAVNELVPEEELASNSSQEQEELEEVQDNFLETLAKDMEEKEEEMRIANVQISLAEQEKIQQEAEQLQQAEQIEETDMVDTQDKVEEEIEQTEEQQIMEESEMLEETVMDTLEEENAEKDLLEQVISGTEKEEDSFEAEESEVDVNEVTVITKGTKIDGSISCDCSLEINGTINGDVECLGKLTILGNVKGNSTASEILVNTTRLDGGLSSKGSVKVGVGTVVVGDIKGTSGVFAGAVKGEIDIDGPVVIDSTAIIKGNINAKSVQINNGAVVDGYCSLTYANVDIDNFFE